MTTWVPRLADLEGMLSAPGFALLSTEETSRQTFANELFVSAGKSDTEPLRCGLSVSHPLVIEPLLHNLTASPQAGCDLR